MTGALLSPGPQGKAEDGRAPTAPMDLASTFPALEAIEDDDLRTGVRDAWATACADAGIETTAALADVPWFPPIQQDRNIEASLVEHVRDVTRGAVALAEAVRAPVDEDLLRAGALVHDVSKLAEFDGMATTRTYDLLGHPHYGVHVVAAANLPVELQHIVLSHTDRTSVNPATLEAALVRRADEAAAATLRWRGTTDLRS